MRTPTLPSRRLVARVSLGAGLVALTVLLLLAMAPLGWLRAPAERALSAGSGQRVRLGHVERLDYFTLSPRLALRDVRIAQPAWAGSGEMLTLRAATVRLPLLPLLRGVARPRDLELEGMRLALVHDDGKRANWEGDGSGGGPVDFGTVAIRDARITLDDARREVKLAGTVAADERGVLLDATGTHRGTPARLTLTAAAVAGDAAWPFRLVFASPLARLRLDAAAARPLAFAQFAGTATASGTDLNRIDDLILAGLPGTQAVRVTAKVRHAERAWVLTDLVGTIGTSRVAGRISADKRAGRNVVDGRLTSPSLDFDDLASDKDQAEAAAKRAALGKRIIPDTRIDLAKLDDTDGRLVVEAKRLRSGERAAITAFATTLTLDRSRLTAAPLTLALRHGRLEGRAVVDQRDGAPPRLDIDLRMVGSRLEDFVTGGRVAAPLRGTIRLSGRGRTLRSAIGRADGRLSFAARGGVVERGAAELLGRNAGAAFGVLLGEGAKSTPLRCLGVTMRASRGVLTPTLFALDTGVMRATGRGTIRLSDERVAITLDGRSKHPGLARLPAPIDVGGTLALPTLETADAGLGSAKTILSTIGKAVGRLFSGEREAPAPDMDCAALMRQVG